MFRRIGACAAARRNKGDQEPRGGIVVIGYDHSSDPRLVVLLLLLVLPTLWLRGCGLSSWCHHVHHNIPLFTKVLKISFIHQAFLFKITRIRFYTC